MELLDEKEILKRKKSSDMEKHPGIYFLIKDDEIVYVGTSKNIPNRIIAHKSDKKNNPKDFNYYTEIKLPNHNKKQREDIESKYIDIFNPIYNKTLGSYEKLGLVTTWCMRTNFGWKSQNAVRRWLFKNNINTQTLGKYNYLKEIEVYEAILNKIENPFRQGVI